MSDQLPEISKGRKAAKYRGSECLNCSTPLELTDKYCSYCGQLNTTKSLSLKDFLGEFIGSIITYDSRFRYTIKDLLFKPGVISRNYIAGQRLKYANPFRFYLSVSIIYFILQGLITTFTGKSTGMNFNFNDKNNNLEIITENDSLIARPEIKLDSILLANGMTQEEYENLNVPDTQKIDSIIKTGYNKTKDNFLEYKYIPEDSLQKLGWSERTTDRILLYYKFYNKTKIKNEEVALDSLNHPNTKYNRWSYQKGKVIYDVAENPQAFFQYLMEKIPFFIFFFIPIFSLFFWLVYSKKKYTYMEHMVFIFHIFSFVFLGALIASLPDAIIGQKIFYAILFGIVGPFYFYKALRNFYKQKRVITILKFMFFNFVFFVGANITATIFFFISAALY